jgi:hypothetical protein
MTPGWWVVMMTSGSLQGAKNTDEQSRACADLAHILTKMRNSQQVQMFYQTVA